MGEHKVNFLPYPSVRVFLGIEMVAFRVASRHTNATTILFAILCSVSPRHLKWQLFCNDQFLSQRETRLTEGRMLCPFATWRITNGTSWFFQAVFYEHLGENWNMMNFLTTVVSLPLGSGGPRNRNQMVEISYMVNFYTTHPSVNFCHNGRRGLLRGECCVRSQPGG